MKKNEIELRYQVVVVGGGISGVCAALASARHGAKTALIQDRPVLGGNASSEIRMHICGANREGSRENARETGIIEELLLENQARNPQHSFSVCDTILWEKTMAQEHLTLFLNTRFLQAEAADGEIQSIAAHQLTTEKNFRFTSDVWIDATGDGLLAAQAGAHILRGREGKKAFNESLAPDMQDAYTMGNSIMFTA
ncbi:MAG: FAD-dependent oxidoreductase, partial [Clostridia bacterium]